jgi:hypothetical protein
LVNIHAATTVTWTGPSGNAVYDIASSQLSDLPTVGTSSATCLSNDLADETYLDTRVDPSAGDGYYYLIRAQSACGRGSYGIDSAGAERAPAVCP